MRTFFLHTKCKSGLRPLYVRVRKRAPKLDIWIKTFIDVDVEKWTKCNGSLTAYSKCKGCSNVKVLVQKVNHSIDYMLMNGCFDAQHIRLTIGQVVLGHLNNKLSAENTCQVKVVTNAKECYENNEKQDVVLFLDNQIKGMKDGTIRVGTKSKNRGRRYQNGTINSWMGLRYVLVKYLNGNKLYWNEINSRLAVDFLNYLERNNYMAKTINKLVGMFIAMINKSYFSNFHNNSEALHAFFRRHVDDNEKMAEIYLTNEELDVIYNLRLTEQLSKIRDLFIIGCYTCQRFSDYGELSKENFMMMDDGKTPFLRLKQKKTGKIVHIPVLDNRLLEIAHKYNYKFPRISNCVMNHGLKTICKMAASKIVSLNKEITTILTKRELELEKSGKTTFKYNEKGEVVKPKYELVSTHTARRTGITLMYKSGKLDLFQMMLISGHSSPDIFKQYIRLSGEEIVAQITEKLDGKSIF